MTREELIAALEKAEGPSRELDAAIGRFLGLEIYDTDWHLIPSGMEEGQKQIVPIPTYTSSLDWALTLVPEKIDCIYFSSDPSGSGWKLGEFTDGEVHMRGEGATGGLWAIALCIAALKACAP